MPNRYNWKKDVCPLLEKVAKKYHSDEKTNKEKQIYEAFYSYQSIKIIKERKATKVVMVNFIKADTNERFEDGFIYADTLEKIAE